MAGFPVLTTYQPIIGVDFHKSVPPPPPAGPLMTPHLVLWSSGMSQSFNFLWSVASTSKASTPLSGCAKPTAVGLGHACGRTHDAGPHLGHIWPNVMMPLITLASGSKSEFGSGTVKVAVSSAGGKQADLAINVGHALNFNLDCNDFPLPPAPTGLCFAMAHNVTAGFTSTDFLRGLIQMLLDSGVAWAVGLGCAVPGAVLSGIIGTLMGRGALAAFAKAFKDALTFKTASSIMRDGAGYFVSNGRLFVEAWRFTSTAAKFMFKNDPAGTTIGIAETLSALYGLGTPIGYAPQDAPVGGYGARLSKQVDGLFK